MANPNRIFRQAALDRLSSPEQLDQLMQVTTPKGRLALWACCGLLLTALLWSFLGEIRTKVNGPGILVNEGGVFVATARSDGHVLQLAVNQGDNVSSNQLLARLQLPELELRITQSRMTVQRLQSELTALNQFHTEEAEKERAAQDQQVLTYTSMIRDFQSQIEALTNRVQKLEILLANENAAVSRVQLLETTNSLFLVQHDLARTRIQLKQIEVDKLQSAERRRQVRLAKEADLMASQQDLEFQTQLHQLNSEIRSPYDGTVLSIMIKPGQLISPKTAAMTLQRQQERLEARLFLPPDQGKRVQKGMAVALAPASVKKELHGLLLGTVTEVSPFPARPDSMLTILENPTLVEEFSRQGAPIGIVVRLQPSETDAGYAWTSGKSPPIDITSGTLCAGTITITTNRPIHLLLPMLKNNAGW